MQAIVLEPARNKCYRLLRGGWDVDKVSIRKLAAVDGERLGKALTWYFCDEIDGNKRNEMYIYSNI